MSTALAAATVTQRRSLPLGAALGTALLVWTTWSFWWAYQHHFAVVWNPASPQWWQWSDQGRYMRAAQAWSEGALDPTRHWYFPLYPLLGAAFVRVLPGDPFLPVDLLALLAFAALFVLLARRLSGRPGLAAPVAAAVFVASVLYTKYELKAFVEPWTTTPTAPLTLAALLLTLRLWERPGAARAGAAGLAVGLVFAARPTDALPLGTAIAGCSAVALRRLPFRRWARTAAGGALGAAVPAALALGAYLAVFGWHRSLYLQQSAETGFEWRLLPLHWVTLMVSPLPEFRELSLSQAFAWIPAGVAGMVACLVAARGRARLRHILVIAAACLHCLLYLSYRDLHPPGLLRFGNYHYFKWCIPLFGLYAAFLLLEVRRATLLPAWGAGALAMLLLFSWRMGWREGPAAAVAGARIEGGHTLELPQAPRSVNDGLFVPATGGFAPIYLSSYVMQVGGREFHANADFKAFPVEGGLVFTVLRPMPAGAATIGFPADVLLLGPPRPLRAHLFWRWPRLLGVIGTYATRAFDTGDR